MPIDPSVGRMVVETRHRDRDRDIERETHLIMMYVRSSAMVVASMCARACAVETGIHQTRSGRAAAGPCPPSFFLYSSYTGEWWSRVCGSPWTDRPSVLMSRDSSKSPS